MTKNMGLIALGLSMALLSGCGSDSDGDIGGGEVLQNSPAVVENNIVGDWLSACVAVGNGSEIERMILNDSGTGQYTWAEYSAPGCNDADIIDSEDDALTYTIGEATTGSEGEDAVEVNMQAPGIDYYSMVHFVTVDQMNIATGDDMDGETPETRHNIFDSRWVLTRQ